MFSKYGKITSHKVVSTVIRFAVCRDNQEDITYLPDLTTDGAGEPSFTVLEVPSGRALLQKHHRLASGDSDGLLICFLPEVLDRNLPRN